MKTPINLIEFIDLLWTEEESLLYLEGKKWWWVCPKCWNEKYWRHKKRRVRICASCKTSLCVTAWTVLHWTRLPIRKILLIVWFMIQSKQWISSEELALMLWIDEKTAWLWTTKIRKIMTLDNRTKLSWNVEVDEVFIWWKGEIIRWRGAKWKVKVVIAVEINAENKNKKGLFRWMWRVRTKIIPNCSEKTLTKFILENVEKESVIYTDWWLWYKNIYTSWYVHIVEKKWVLDDEISWINRNEVTPNIHIIASLIKRWLLWTHQKYIVNKSYFQDYLEEYTFRFNRRHSNDRWKLFDTIIDQILSHKPTTRKQISS